MTTAALFKQQGAIRALGTAAIAAHPELSQTLAEHGLTLDPVSGKVVDLGPFNAVMSKRSAQIDGNLQRLHAEWEAQHPGEEPGPAITARMQACRSSTPPAPAGTGGCTDKQGAVEQPAVRRPGT
ncbi:hypothetical protein ACIPPN_28930 [Streptomyces diastaticus]|uniref:Uncharacterized protein n=1 Tax=Streptomyces diastaticus subsp. diastaticus TaxID=68040 RepID=A0ABQ1CYK4_STRDI|nr:hypothetical protein [Streptomyces diastaticus]GFH75313.1 hypothetical protein Sdia_60810 [Streptomyces diastaticus subsp. diastaticus]GGU49083.1 hypothetical protein GCM10015534_58920 [Streptomyces diastaticus subsp. diastaticus]